MGEMEREAAQACWPCHIGSVVYFVFLSIHKGFRTYFMAHSWAINIYNNLQIYGMQNEKLLHSLFQNKVTI